MDDVRTMEISGCHMLSSISCGSFITNATLGSGGGEKDTAGVAKGN